MQPRVSTGRAQVLYPNICQNQQACSNTCRDNYKVCQTNCGYNSLCLNGCTDVLNSCVSKVSAPSMAQPTNKRA
jgi:hypothetical protein